MDEETKRYNDALAPGDRAICRLLAARIDRELPEAENKIWHAHPVWFLDGNPVVGYSKLKDCVRLLFWSGRRAREGGEVQGRRSPVHGRRPGRRGEALALAGRGPGRPVGLQEPDPTQGPPRAAEVGGTLCHAATGVVAVHSFRSDALETTLESGS
jgi:hypothetical protein